METKLKYLGTPRNLKINVNGSFVELKFNPARFADRNGSFQKAQRYIDSEVLRLSEPYTPLLTGQLIKSAKLATVIGSGLVVWNTPYARAQYYNKQVGRETGPLRGGYWFERMKATRGKEIINGAKARAGR